MHSSQNRSKRKRGKNVINDDDTALVQTAVSRTDDIQTDAYGRSRPPGYQQHTDTYFPSTSRSTSTYTMSRDGPSSHVDSQDHFHPHTSDGHYRTGRDSYDAPDSRDGDQRRPRFSHENDFQSGGRDRTSREFVQTHSVAHRNESQGWGSLDNHDDGPQWASPPSEWRRGDVEEDRSSKGWDNTRHKESRPQGNRRWQSDNGWETRKRDRHQNRRPPDNQEDGSFVKDERAWEPGPGWQGRGDQSYRNQRGRGGSGKMRGKKQYQQNRQRQRADKDRDQDRRWDRDRRNDNDTLNNWQRREFHPLPPKPPVKRGSSVSRSRSRTPESAYSRPSSRGRSRSRSFSPQPDVRHSSPVRHRSHTPGREIRSKSPPSSQRSYVSRGPPRGRSVSSVSSRSYSRSRSSSRSPADRPRAKHRLPPATSIREISVSISKTTLQQRSNLVHDQKSDSTRNDKVDTNGHAAVPSIPSESARRSVERMPPPSIVPPISDHHQEIIVTTSATHQRRDPDSPTRAKFSKPTGFKPITLASSSVKMFFPRDDQEHHGLQRHELPARPEVPMKRMHDDVATDKDEYSLQITGKPYLQPPSPPLHEVLPAAVEVIAELRPTSPCVQDVSKVPISPKINGDLVTPAPQPRPSEPEIDAVTRASSPSMTSRKELYAIVSQVGEGTFGKVYKARNTITNVHVALKRIRMEAEKDGFPVTAMREIKLLQSLRHQNIVRLYEMMVSNGSVFMVFEYMDHDLTGVLSQTQFSFSEANLKSLCNQMLAGLAYLHHKGVIHRDVKGSNILINNRGELKLADFGLARFYQKRRRIDYTNRVITLWYRPPELLFGATVYGPEVDMWSAGCIMLELFTKKPIFQGNDEIHQLEVIYRIFGTPTPERWPGITGLPWYELVKPKEVLQDHFRELFKGPLFCTWLSPAALDLAEQLLTYDPTKRVTAAQALEAPYFREELPPAELPIGLSTLEGEWHELETKRERAKKRRKLENSVQPHPV
ncbi:kinase-like domain-containing protein [Chiua virens]|nr:kinase-like domain-containing protein [Chiua virens]